MTCFASKILCIVLVLSLQFHGGPPSFPPNQGPFPAKLQHHHPKQDHAFAARSSPGPHHREPMHPPGAIGSGIPSTHKSHSLPNAHTPPPYPYLLNRPEMWMHSLPPNMGQGRQSGSFGYPLPRPPAFHPPPFPAAGQPIGFNQLGPPHQVSNQKPVGNQRPVRLGPVHDDTMVRGGGQWGGKRRSVPGYGSLPRPVVPVWGQPPGPSGPQLMTEQPLPQSGDSSSFLSGNGSLSVGDPWSSSWSNNISSSAPAPRQAPPTSSLPPMSFSQPSSSSSNVVASSTTPESWLSSSGEGDDGGDLGQLLKSLDISDEHARGLKVWSGVNCLCVCSHCPGWLVCLFAHSSYSVLIMLTSYCDLTLSACIFLSGWCANITLSRLKT